MNIRTVMTATTKCGLEVAYLTRSRRNDGDETCGYGRSWEFAITCSEVNFYVPSLGINYPR